MEPINQIIKALDDALIATGKSFLSLAEANKLLEKNNLITAEEKDKGAIKALLKENKIPHASKTERAPRQWRIPLSEEGKSRIKEKFENKAPTQPIIPNQETYKYRSKGRNYVTCPKCGDEVFIPEENIKYAYAHCPTCKKEFRNPLKTTYNGKSNFILTKREKTGLIRLIIIVVFVALIIIGSFSEDSSSPSLYYMNETTYAGTSKSSFDDFIQDVSVKDNDAVANLLLTGELVNLTKGTEVYLVSAHFGYCVVRKKGSNEKLWISSGFITQK